MQDGTKRRILLIDDDTSLLVTLSDFLRFENYDVVTAESGEQGLEELKTVSPDLIILDMSMPGMGGIGFLKSISSSDGKPRYPVLVLTARANMAEFFANVDVDGFIAKPCEPSDLLMEVGRILFLRGGDVGEETSAGKSAEKLRVLIGEDEDDTREHLVTRLAAAGFVVDGVAKGPEVIEKAVVERPDVVVVKLVLENMNGDTVAGMLQQMDSTRDIPVVLYDDTDSHAPESKLKAASPRICSIVRSSDPDALQKAVREALAK